MSAQSKESYILFGITFSEAQIKTLDPKIAIDMCSI